MCNVLFRGGGEKNFMFFFSARKAVDICWEVVYGQEFNFCDTVFLLRFGKFPAEEHYWPIILSDHGSQLR